MRGDHLLRVGTRGELEFISGTCRRLEIFNVVSASEPIRKKNVVRLEFNFGVSAEVDKQIQSSIDLHIFSASI